MRTHVLHEQTFPCQVPIRVEIVPATADILDERGDKAEVCLIQFRSFGNVAFSGRVATIRCHEDNVLVRKRAGEPGEGRVLVVDAGGSMRCALVGDSIATLALENGWAGIVLNGCVRDSRELDRVGLGIKALGTNPRPSRKEGAGEIDVPVSFGDVTFMPGAALLADEDGVVILRESVGRSGDDFGRTVDHAGEARDNVQEIVLGHPGDVVLEARRAVGPGVDPVDRPGKCGRDHF